MPKTANLPFLAFSADVKNGEAAIIHLLDLQGYEKRQVGRFSYPRDRQNGEVAEIPKKATVALLASELGKGGDRKSKSTAKCTVDAEAKKRHGGDRRSKEFQGGTSSTLKAKARDQAGEKLGVSGRYVAGIAKVTNQRQRLPLVNSPRNSAYPNVRLSIACRSEEETQNQHWWTKSAA